MNVLAIETSNPTASARRGSGVALGVRSGNAWERLWTEKLRPTGRHDDALMPGVSRLCTRAGVAPREIDRVAVSIGPGGFTGIRIGVVTAKIIAMAAGAEVVGAPSSLVAALARRQFAPLAVVLAGKRGTAWVARYSAENLDTPRASEHGRIMGADDLPALHERSPFGTLLAGVGAPVEFLAWARTAGVRVSPLLLSPLRVLEAAALLSPVSPEALLPLYPREPEAVRTWRERD